MTSVELFVSELARRGVNWMATLCGHGLDPLFHAARRAGMRLVDTRNEQTAAYLAECYGRLARTPGVCCVSSGVAHVNALTGVTNAWFDGAPMLLVSGAGARVTAGMGHFQDMPQVEMAAPVAGYARVLDEPARTVEILDAAWRAALHGPAHLTYPMDVQTAAVSEPVAALPAAARAFQEDDLSEALAGAERPLIVAGSGVYYAGAGPDLLRFAEAARIPVVAPIWDRGIVDRASDVFMGVIGAASGGPRLLPDADCVIMAGARTDYRTGFLQRADLKVAHVTRNWNTLPPRTFEGWLDKSRKRRDEFRAGIERRGAEQASAGLHAVDIAAALRDVLDESAVLIIDGGSIGQWAHQLLCSDRYPGHWLTCGPSGVVGYGIGGAMAARLAHPGRPIVLLAGDGAFTFNVAELECAARQNLHFTAIVADDLGWGITRTGHIRQFGEAISSSLGPIAFDRLAEALGARGRKAAGADALREELEAALREPAVTVIHVPVVGGNPA